MNYQASSDRAMKATATAGTSLNMQADKLTGMSDAFAPALRTVADAGTAVPIDTFVGQAAADAQSSAENARSQTLREMTRMGVNPNSGRFAAIEANWARAFAAASTGAKTRARQIGSDTNFQRATAVAQMGLNIGQQANAARTSAAGINSRVAEQLGSAAEDQAAWGEYSDDIVQAKLNRDTEAFAPSKTTAAPVAKSGRTAGGNYGYAVPYRTKVAAAAKPKPSNSYKGTYVQ